MQSQQKVSFFVWPFKTKKRIRLDVKQMGGKQRWAVLHDNEVIWADNERTRQQCYPMKRPVWAAWPMFPHMIIITVAVCLMGFLWSSQVNSRASLSSTKAEQQLYCVGQNDGFSDIVKKCWQTRNVWVRSRWHVQSVSGCFKCQVLIGANSRLLRRHVRLCKSKRRWFTNSW